METSTRRYKPWRLLYYEAYQSEKDARQREKRLKSHGNAVRELKKRIRDSFKNGAGFIFITPIIFLLIGAVIGASITLGIVQYKDKIIASVSNVFKKNEIVVSDTPAQSPESIEAGPPACKTCGGEPETAPKPEPKPAPKPKPKPQPPPPPQPEADQPQVEAPAPQSEPESTPAPAFEPTPGLDPDLTIQLVKYPTAPVEGDMMNFSAAVKNQGEGSTNVSIANLSIDEINIKQITTSILLSNTIETLIWKEVWKATKGDHKLKICLDADSKIPESNEENNCFEARFYVSKTQLLADYIIKWIKMTPESPVAGDMLSFDAKVYNQGNAFDAGSSSTRLRIDLDNDGAWDIPTKNASTEPLDPNTDERENWMNVWTIPQGTHKYEICADALSNINESNENNNCTSKIFTVP